MVLKSTCWGRIPTKAGTTSGWYHSVIRSFPTTRTLELSAWGEFVHCEQNVSFFRPRLFITIGPYAPPFS